MKKILVTSFLYFSLNSAAFTENLILGCGYSFKPDFYYIDNVKKTVNGIGINKKEKIIEIYDWFYKNVKFENDKVSFNTDGNFLYHIPENFPFYKIEIDRDTLELVFYEKDRDDLPDFLSSLPFAIQDQVRKLLKWKINDIYTCKIVKKKIYENYTLKFVPLNEVQKRETRIRKNKF